MIGTEFYLNVIYFHLHMLHACNIQQILLWIFKTQGLIYGDGYRFNIYWMPLETFFQIYSSNHSLY